MSFCHRLDVDRYTQGRNFLIKKRPICFNTIANSMSHVVFIMCTMPHLVISRTETIFLSFGSVTSYWIWSWSFAFGLSTIGLALVSFLGFLHFGLRICQRFPHLYCLYFGLSFISIFPPLSHKHLKILQSLLHG